jgi:hypothetical protein
VSYSVESRSLSRRECLERLTAAEIGRIVFSANCLPAARPVHLDLEDDHVLIAVGPEIDRQAIRFGYVVALEIDDSSPSAAASWAVSVTGVVLEVFDDPLAELPPSPLSWAPSAGLSLLSMSVDRVEGHGFAYRCSPDPSI